jgi:hypothetical protein
MMRDFEKEIIGLSTEQLIEKLHDTAAIARAFALNELAKRTRKDEALLPIVKEEILKRENQNLRLRGTVSISHFGMVGLAEAKSAKAIALIESLLANWEEPDKSDLLLTLENTGIHLKEDQLQAA